jgi:hypothetical protein
MKTSFHQAAVAIREKAYSNNTALLNSKGFRPVGKRDKARQKAAEQALKEPVRDDKQVQKAK